MIYARLVSEAHLIAISKSFSRISSQKHHDILANALGLVSEGLVRFLLYDD